MQKILRQLATGPLPRVLLVHGSETIWRDRAFKILKERNSQDEFAEWNWSTHQGEKEFDLDSLLAELAMVPWGDSSKIIILQEANLIPPSIMEELALWLRENSNANFLAIFLDKIDKRWKFLKILNEFAVELDCAPLEGEGLIRYISDYCTEREKTIKRPVIEVFLDRVGRDLMIINNELDKLIAFSGADEEISQESVLAITSLSPGQVVNDTIFKMMDFIMEKKRKEALEVLNLMLDSGEPALRILPLIERQLRLLLVAKTSSTDLDHAAKNMGERSSFPLKKARAQAKNFSTAEIFSGFEFVLYADRELKLGVPGQQVLTDLIIKLT
ncbi:MAG: DNA polymerase III subunit delta [Bacillota bacterium]|mgnify:CR=1 FL=1|nr:DNA polymerase III subunit delta [Bacillota bacterium]